MAGVNRAGLSAAQRKADLHHRLLEHMKIASAAREEEAMMDFSSSSFVNPIHLVRNLPLHYHKAGGHRGVAKIGVHYVGQALIAKMKQQLCRWICY